MDRFRDGSSAMNGTATSSQQGGACRVVPPLPLSAMSLIRSKTSGGRFCVTYLRWGLRLAGAAARTPQNQISTYLGKFAYRLPL